MNPATPWRAWLAAGAIFVFGLAVGIAGTSLYGLRTLRRTLQPPPPNAINAVDRTGNQIVNDLVASLNLGPAEEARVRREFAQTSANLRALRAQSIRQTIAELRQFARRVAADLPPEQRAAFYNRLEHRLQRLGLEGRPLRPEGPAPGSPPNPQPGPPRGGPPVDR